MKDRLSEIKQLGIENIGLWPKEIKWSIVGALFCLVVFLGYWFDLKDQVKALGMSVAFEENVIEQIDAATNSTKEMKKTLTEITTKHQKLGALLKRFPKKLDIENLTKEIKRISQSDSLQLVVLKVDNVIKNESYSVVPIRIRVVGDFHHLVMFEKSIGQLSQPMRFSKISLRPENSKIKGSEGIKLVAIDLQQPLRLELDAEFYSATK